MSAIYKGLINFVDKFVPKTLRPLWEHPAGPKTVFFWAPAFKWALVIAGIGDIKRPVENLSVKQCVTLCATGFIWARYSLVITPVNYPLFSVNCFLGCVQLGQLVRVLLYQRSLQEQDDDSKRK